MKPKTEYLVCGAGPVGLYAALWLRRAGRQVRIVDQATGPPRESRAIGIHPPSLSLFAELGVAERLVATGLRLERARVFVDGGQAALVDFGGLAHAYPFVLSLPQAELVRLLLAELAAAGCDVTWRRQACGISQNGEGVRVEFEDGACIEAGYLLVCDGMRSDLRQAMGSQWHGRTYPDTYLMGDARAIDGEPAVAHVYLGCEGLVESLPMPGGRRRWVVRQRQPDAAAGWDELRRTVAARTGVEVEPAVGDSWCFRTHGYVARPLWCGRAFLLGDAAHVVSPIGGQGMNLGWLNARQLLPDLCPRAAEAWARMAVRRAGKARRQAYFNMALGRPQGCPRLLRGVMGVALRPPLLGPLRRRFAMLQLV